MIGMFLSDSKGESEGRICKTKDIYSDTGRYNSSVNMSDKGH